MLECAVSGWKPFLVVVCRCYALAYVTRVAFGNSAGNSVAQGSCSQCMQRVAGKYIFRIKVLSDLRVVYSGVHEKVIGRGRCWVNVSDNVCGLSVHPL